MTRIGDGPIEPQYREQMIELARYLNRYFNGEAPVGQRGVGFVLLVFPFQGQEGRCNYISNGADRGDIVCMFKEQISRFEGMPGQQGTA